MKATMPVFPPIHAFAYRILCLLLLASSIVVNAQNPADVIFYNKAAVNFNEAIPLGNGRMGAMVYGRVQSEYISLNEQTLWSGGPNIKWNNPDAKNYLPLVRAAALAGEYKKADSLSKFMQGPYTQSYLPMADLQITYTGIDDSSNYRRSLDLDSAICHTVFTDHGIRHLRSAFVSFPGRVMVLRNTASKPGAISFSIKLSSKLHFFVKIINGNEIILTGKCPQHVEPGYLWRIKDPEAIQYAPDQTGEGMTFEIRLLVKNEGGKIYADDSTLRVEHATSTTVLITAATSFNGFDRSPGKEGKDPSVECKRNLLAANARRYSQLLLEHVADYKPLYQRVVYDFGKSIYTDLPTDERLKKMEHEFDPQLLATIVQFGRYLLITTSRPGGQPGNLKGLWNEKLRPEYSANWCIDHDAQMYYYPVETNNLSEMHEPFLKLIEELSINGYKTAAINYGMRGWCAHHNTDIWRKSSPVGNWGEGNPHWATWNMSAAWLCNHLFEHYLFTRDQLFLKQKAWPVIKDAAMFCLDWLIMNSSRNLISVPSVSPENTFITEEGDTAQISINATSDIELIKDLFGNCIKTATLLNLDNSFIDSIKTAYNKLAPYSIGSKNQLLEWSREWKAMDPGHRHLSHLFAVYPGSEISPDNDSSLADAAKRALTLREKTNGSWGFAWKAACWARLHEADSAWLTLQYQLRYVDAKSTSSKDNYGLYPNLFNSEVPGIILNGNTCITSVVTEMLVQSHTRAIRLLPSLPAVLHTGSVKGLCTRGGFEVEMSWKDKNLVNAVIYSKLGNECNIYLPHGYKVFFNKSPIAIQQNGKSMYSFKTIKGQRYVIKAS